MTIFRGSFGVRFMAMFFTLLAGKIWGWIGEGRVEILEQQPPANPRLFHTRLSISLALSVLFAACMLNYTVQTVLIQAKPDMMVMFGFEFAIITILAVSTAARYAICLTELYIVRKQKAARLDALRAERAAINEANRHSDSGGTVSDSTTAGASEPSVDEVDVEVEGWEEKGQWMFYLNLMTGTDEWLASERVGGQMLTFGLDFLKLTVYVTFFSVLLASYGLPLHIMRDLFLSFRSFFKRVADFVRYRNATRDMHERYPDATPDEIGREDVCIICREEMRAHLSAQRHGQSSSRSNPLAERMRPKKLLCGHVLHFSCLRSWLERQQNCPTCRRPVIAARSARGAGTNGTAAPDNVPAQPGGPDVAPAAQPGAPNRARIINFGPFRIGFGAGAGNVVEDLAQQIHQGDPRLAGAAAPAHGNGTGTHQHFGFGFGFGRRRQAVQAESSSAPSSSASIQVQLDQIERNLQQQINELRVANDQLHTIRQMQTELSRLRSLQSSGAGTEAINASTPHSGPLSHIPAGPLPSQSSQLPSPIPSSAVPTVLSSYQQPTLSSGSANLPEGMTLPPGWTLLPLKRTTASPRPSVPQGHNLHQARTTNIQTGLASSSPAPATDPIANSSDPDQGASTELRQSDAVDSVNAAKSPTPKSTSSLPHWGSASQRGNGAQTVSPPVTTESLSQHPQSTESVVTSMAEITSSSFSTVPSYHSSTSPVGPAPPPPHGQGQKTHEKNNDKAAKVEDEDDETG